MLEAVELINCIWDLNNDLNIDFTKESAGFLYILREYHKMSTMLTTDK